MIYCVLVLGGGAYKVMSYFKVIGIDKAKADRCGAYTIVCSYAGYNNVRLALARFAFVLRIQKLEEQEDYIIMMKERKNSKWLHIDSHIITPFLTWQGT